MVTSIDKLKIENKLRAILNNLSEIEVDFLKEDIFDQQLLGPTFNFRARNLLYLFFEVEREFSVSIPEEDIANGKFSTLNNIVDIILRQTEKSDLK